MNNAKLLKIVNIQRSSDIVGAAASTLCLIHCLLTPLLFVVQAGIAHGHSSHPYWWGVLDWMFAAISLFAVAWSARKTSLKWVGIALWISWVALIALIANEKTGWVQLAEWTIYVPAILLVLLHLYNHQSSHIRCDGNACKNWNGRNPNDAA